MKETGREMEEPSSKSTTITRSINHLPNDILIHILSFLPTTLDAIQTKSISREWRHLCRSIPNLTFIQDPPFPSSPSASPAQTLDSFAHFITQTLALRNPQAPLLRFRLALYVDEVMTSHVDVWIWYAIRYRVTEIELVLPRNGDDDSDDDGDDDNFDRWKDVWYCFNLRVLSNSNVKVLKLNECKISVPRNMSDSNVISSSLQSLSLCIVNVTDQIVSEILTGCVNLEDLVIYRCEDLEDLKIHSTKLKKLSLKDCTHVKSVEIFAPNLDLLVLFLFQSEKYVFSDVSSLVEARISCAYYWYWSLIVRLLGHVQRLTLQNCWFELLLLENPLPVPESFLLYNLNYLGMRTGYSKAELLGLAALLERCPNLEAISLIKVTKPYEEEVLSKEFLKRPITLNIPSLRTAELTNYTQTENELLLVGLLEEEGVENILLYPTEVGEPSLAPKEKRLTGRLYYSFDDF